MVDRDQFKYTACSITNEECCEYSCTNCELAATEEKAENEQRKLDEIENYTRFERNVFCMGRRVLTNRLNIVAVITPEDLDIFKTEKIVSVQESGYSPTALRQYFPALRKLRIHNNLPIPDQCWAKKDFPGVFRFGDVYYMIAPRIRSDEVRR